MMTTNQHHKPWLHHLLCTNQTRRWTNTTVKMLTKGTRSNKFNSSVKNSSALIWKENLQWRVFQFRLLMHLMRQDQSRARNQRSPDLRWKFVIWCSRIELISMTIECLTYQQIGARVRAARGTHPVRECTTVVSGDECTVCCGRFWMQMRSKSHVVSRDPWLVARSSPCSPTNETVEILNTKILL